MIVLAAFLDDVDDWEAMATAAAAHGCRFVVTDDLERTCRATIYARLVNLRAAAPRGEVTFDSGLFQQDATTAAVRPDVVASKLAKSDDGCAVELAAATEWRERGPVYLEGLAQNSLPLAYVSRCELPPELRVCFGVYDRAVNRRPWGICEATHQQFRAGARAPDSYGLVDMPYEVRMLSCLGVCSIIAFVVDEDSDTNTPRTAK